MFVIFFLLFLSVSLCFLLFLNVSYSEVRKEAGHQIDDMLLWCFIGGDSCNVRFVLRDLFLFLDLMVPIYSRAAWWKSGKIGPRNGEFRVRISEKTGI